MISNKDQRVLFYDSSANSMADITKEVNDYNVGSVSLTFDAGDYLYFGSFYPINHKYFEIITPNVTVADIAPQIFDGNSWRTPINVFDYTTLSGVTMAQSGRIELGADTRQYQWAFRQDTREDSALPEFVNGPEIYWKYWSRLGFTQDGVAFDLSYVGDLFATNQELLQYYPAFDSSVLLTSWEPGKTDWKDQLILASEYVIMDLKRRSVIDERSQIIELSNVVEPAINYAAYIIWSGLGPRNYAEEAKAAYTMYDNSMQKAKFEVDVNIDSQKERYESVITQRRMRR